MANKQGRPKKDTSRISAQVILEAARTLTAVSRKLPSIRAIAKHLDVDPMAIYHYFDSKQALLESMASSIVTTVYQPKPRARWEAELAKLAISYVETLRAYPGLLEAMLANPVVGPVEMFAERFDAATAKLEADELIRRHALYLFIDYLHGFVCSATCAGDQGDLLETEEVVKPLHLLFAAMRTPSFEHLT